MQTFQDSVTQQVYAFETDVIVTDTAGVYSFKTAAGVALTLPTTLVPYAVPPPVVNPLVAAAAQVAAALAAGLTITSTATPAVNGTYPIDPSTQDHIQAEVVSILLNGAFADGTASVVWLDTADAPHTFPSVATFKNFAAAVASYVAALFKFGNGTLTTLPPATATIP